MLPINFLNRSILDSIGNTPLLEMNLEYNDENWHFYAKLEFLNPSGSIKDRIAKHVLELAEHNREIKPDSIIIEATSGNTGISFAMVCAVKGYRCIIVMPENMSVERQKIITMFGAEICLTPQNEFYQGAMQRTRQMSKLNPKVFLPRQFENPDDVQCHHQTTGQEIIEQMPQIKIDAFVAGIGTGATLMGVIKRLRQAYPDCKAIAVEPKESAVLNGCKNPESHQIPGIGAGFIPALIDTSQIDWCEPIPSQDALAITRQISRKLGMMVGVSSGANILATINVLNKIGKDKTVVTVLPDRSERYFSTDLYQGKKDEIIRNCRHCCENPFCAD
ncbi:MAG: cysteine synthase family protein [Candidatus Latescibacteria bacterium]|nr:cysteine synthase family protein [Candidatus Latescibacterota bacterium]